MKTAVIYARYSCDNQSEQSIEGQLRVCEEYAQHNNILILNTYIDRAMTGTNDNRPDFQRMLKDSSRQEWNYILVYKLDRFSRNKYETAIHKKTLKDNGIKVLSAMENIPDTPEGLILESLLEGMNQYYSAELSQKVRRGMKETRLKGFFQGGTILYGYKVEDRKIVIDDYQAEVVRFMYEQYSKGVYVKDIIASLTAKGVLYKGKPFVRNSVYNILKNDKYSGVYKHGEEVVSNMYPRIIDSGLFNRVRNIINANKYGKGTPVRFLLKGKVKCGYCGNTVSAESGTTKSGTRIYYYKCLGRKKRINDCNKSMIRKEVLEELILNSIIAEMSKPNAVNAIVKYLLNMQEQMNKNNPNLSLLLKQQKQNETALNNLIAAIERGIISNTTNKRLHDLESQQADLGKQILIEKSKTAVKVTEKDIREFYEQALRLAPQMLVNYLIREIVLFDDKIDIYFNSPIKSANSPDDSLGFCFYSETFDMAVIQIKINMCV